MVIELVRIEDIRHKTFENWSINGGEMAEKWLVFEKHSISAKSAKSICYLNEVKNP